MKSKFGRSLEDRVGVEEASEMSGCEDCRGSRSPFIPKIRHCIALSIALPNGFMTQPAIGQANGRSDGTIWLRPLFQTFYSCLL